jgi:hypothetical protein
MRLNTMLREVPFVQDTYQLPPATPHAQAAPPPPTHRSADPDTLTGVPLRTRRTNGARWRRGRRTRRLGVVWR